MEAGSVEFIMGLQELFTSGGVYPILDSALFVYQA